MAEYEDRYPEAYGRGEEIDPPPRRRHFLGIGLLRQVRDRERIADEAGRDASPAASVRDVSASLQTQTQRPARPRHVERPRQPLVERSPHEICDDVAEQLAASPFIDASGIEVAVAGVEVTLGGTINSLIAISLAQALASNVPGVARVQVNLRVQQAPRRYETPQPS
jgi:osmotically-inducible protein OsmY